MLQLDPHIAALEKAVAEACPADCAKLIGELERVKAQAWSRLVAAPASPSRQGPERPYTIPEVALILRVSVYRAYQLARKGTLPSTKIGKLIRVTAAQLTEFQQRVNSTDST